MRLAVIVQPDGSTSRVDLDADNALKVMQAAVGGLIECVRLTDQVEFYCNEEGLYTFTPDAFNPYASALMREVYGEGYILGPVIFTGGIDRQGETRGMLPAMADMIALGASPLN